jgi:hypothetical protein
MLVITSQTEDVSVCLYLRIIFDFNPLLYHIVNTPAITDTTLCVT